MCVCVHLPGALRHRTQVVHTDWFVYRQHSQVLHVELLHQLRLWCWKVYCREQSTTSFSVAVQRQTRTSSQRCMSSGTLRTPSAIRPRAPEHKCSDCFRCTALLPAHPEALWGRPLLGFHGKGGKIRRQELGHVSKLLLLLLPL